MRSPLHLKLTFAQHLDPATCDRFVRVHRHRNDERLAHYRELEVMVRGQGHPPNPILAGGIGFRQGLLTWLNSLPWGRR